MGERRSAGGADGNGGRRRQAAGDQLRQRILEAIETYQRAHGRPPTIREIGAAVGISSTGHVSHHVAMLEKQGCLNHERRISRGVASERPSGPLIRGTIAAGDPLYVADGAELDVLDLSDGMITRGAPGADGELYALRVRGTSMIEEGILPGDYVLIAPGRSVTYGAVCVALERCANGGRGAATLKRVFVETEHVRLQPANSEVETREISREVWDRDWEVQGTLIAVYRCYDRHPTPRVGDARLQP